jgi:hypothetical protein
VKYLIAVLMACLFYPYMLWLSYSTCVILSAVGGGPRITFPHFQPFDFFLTTLVGVILSTLAALLVDLVVLVNAMMRRARKAA